ncbi:hypothetical protein AG1IA_05269 [Rhizoctonia solani AG-1 IA]|uniref:Uncharacterized protein n=1 Tax=Thanatephorus cucumeris (strain AG1-IA) TaxID=983506 RepID=L8WRD5_THACA|nr:hypothetical protein AG1IA_05269 [Rhizoctonia solani AG-1 IA]
MARVWARTLIREPRHTIAIASKHTYKRPRTLTGMTSRVQTLHYCVSDQTLGVLLGNLWVYESKVRQNEAAKVSTG